jgi:hypothetical protein
MVDMGKSKRRKRHSNAGTETLLESPLFYFELKNEHKRRSARIINHMDNNFNPSGISFHD